MPRNAKKCQEMSPSVAVMLMIDASLVINRMVHATLRISGNFSQLTSTVLYLMKMTTELLLPYILSYYS